MFYELITRGDAHAAGMKRFYTGKPCSKGHDSQRFVTTGGCVECGRERANKFANDKKSESGKFVRVVHPADHAAVHAYCDALDLQRGVVPNANPTQQPTSGVSKEVAAAIAQTRAALVKPMVNNSSPHMPQEFKY